MSEKFNLSVILRFITDDRGIKGFQNNMKSLSQSMNNIGREMTTKMTLPIAAGMGLALKSAIDMESAFTGVQKTVNGTAEELNTLKEDLKQMTLEIPLSAKELFGIAEAAGQLGIKTNDISAFTKVMADLGVTTNLTSVDAATALAQFANIMGTSKDDFERMGSTIVALGNSMATNEKRIVDMSMRLAAAGRQAGLNEHQIFALGAALSSLGIEAEAGGSSFSLLLKTIQKAVSLGGDQLNKFSAVAGMSTEEFKKAWKDDAGKAVVNFASRLELANNYGTDMVVILDQLKLSGLRVSDVVGRMAGSSEKMDKALSSGKASWEENLALQKEAELRYGTTASQLTLFKNEVNLLANEFGKAMLPGLRAILKEIKPFIHWLKQLDPEMKENILKIAGVFAIGGPLLLGLSLVASIIAGISLPILGVVAALAGIGTAAFMIINNWKEVKQFFTDLWDGVTEQWRQFVAEWNAEWQRVWNAIPEPIRRWLTGGKVDISNNTTPADLNKVGGMASAAAGFASKSQSEITVRLESAEGTNAAVTDVKGDGKVKVESKVGYTLGGMATAAGGFR